MEKSLRVLIQAEWQGKEEWLRFSSPQAVIEAHSPEEVEPALKAAAEAADSACYVVGFVAYHASNGLAPVYSVKEALGVPAVCFGVFEAPDVVERPKPEDPARLTDLQWLPSWDLDTYRDRVTRIKDYLRAGDTYQVNLTFAMEAITTISADALFASLVASQKPRYAALIESERFAICSISPELFFDYADGNLVSRPMKGTAPRGLDSAEDHEIIQSLSASEKNSAENVMIVDMVRNDMGRIARSGTVHVPRRCEWEPIQPYIR